MSPAASTKKSELAAVAAQQAAAAQSEPAAPPAADAEPAADAGEQSLTDRLATAVNGYNDLIAEHKAFIVRLKEAQAFLKAVQKDAAALQKQAAKKPKRKGDAAARANGQERPLSGFEKPIGISAELAAFLGEPADAQVSRTEVTRRINAYIKENGLQNPENKRVIVPDAKLAALLGTDKMDPPPRIDYFNMQSYTSKHFAKAGKKAEEAVATAAAE